MSTDNQTHQETAYGSNESYCASVPGEPASVGNDDGWIDYLSMGMQMGLLTGLQTLPNWPRCGVANNAQMRGTTGGF